MSAKRDEIKKMNNDYFTINTCASQSRIISLEKRKDCKYKEIKKNDSKNGEICYKSNGNNMLIESYNYTIPEFILHRLFFNVKILKNINESISTECIDVSINRQDSSELKHIWKRINDLKNALIINPKINLLVPSIEYLNIEEASVIFDICNYIKSHINKEPTYCNNRGSDDTITFFEDNKALIDKLDPEEKLNFKKRTMKLKKRIKRMKLLNELNCIVEGTDTDNVNNVRTLPFFTMQLYK
jgi:hypothetical protein